MIHIRKGKSSDIINYLKYQLEAFPTESKARHNKYFKQKIDKNEILVIELDKEYIGHLAFLKSISTPFPNCIYAEEFVISENHRNKGYGNQLFNHLIEKTKKLGFERIMLNTQKSSKNRVLTFYDRLGFKKVGTLNTKYGNESFFELYI